MPKRKVPLVTGKFYHIYNGSVAQQPIFTNQKEYDRFVGLLDFYRFTQKTVRYSHFSQLNFEDKSKYLAKLYGTINCYVEIYSFSIMPNHYHLLTRQNEDGGISNFIRYIQNSYAKYKNIKHERVGSLFRSPFKAVRVESEEQLLHLSRYIHINPLSSYVLKNLEELYTYPWTSLVDYLNEKPRQFVNTSFIEGLLPEKKQFIEFTLNQVAYQRSLEKIKHLIQE